jgi:hypothetical protein
MNSERTRIEAAAAAAFPAPLVYPSFIDISTHTHTGGILSPRRRIWVTRKFIPIMRCMHLETSATVCRLHNSTARSTGRRSHET